MRRSTSGQTSWPNHSGGVDVGRPAHGGHEGGRGGGRRGRRPDGIGVPAVGADEDVAARPAGRRWRSRSLTTTTVSKRRQRRRRSMAPRAAASAWATRPAGPAPDAGVAAHQRRLHVVEVEDAVGCAATWRATRRHLQVLHLEQVDGALGGGPVAPRRRARGCRSGRPRHCGSAARRAAARAAVGRHGTLRTSMPETLEPGHVAVAVVVGAQHDFGALGQAARRRPGRAACPRRCRGAGTNLVTMSTLTATPSRSGRPTGGARPAVHLGRWRRLEPRCPVSLGRDTSTLGQPGAQLVVGDEPIERLGQRVGIAAGARASPLSPSKTKSGMPPARVPTTATPDAWASRTLSPKGSATDALTRTSRARSVAGTSLVRPTKRTRSPSSRLGLGPHPLGVAVGGEPATAHHDQVGAGRGALEQAHGPDEHVHALLGVDATHDPHQRGLLVGA